MAANDILKAQQLQRTQQLIRDINFENAISLPSAVGAENTRNIPSDSKNSSSWLINRYQDSIQKHDMTLIASSLRDITNILDYRKKISGGQENPLYKFFENLRDRAERGEHVSWQEFTNAINTFSADADNLDALQDEINNAGLASETQGKELEEAEEETEVPSNMVPFPETEKKEELPLPDEQQNEDSGSPGISPSRRPLPRPTPIRRPLTNKEVFGTKENYSKYKEADKEWRDERARKLWENRKKAGMNKEEYGKYKEANKEERKERASKLWARRRAASLAEPKLAPAASSSGGLLGALENYQLARDLMSGAGWLARKFGWGRVANLLERLLPEQYLLGAGRFLLNGAMNLGRAALGYLADGAAGLLSRLAFQAALTAARVLVVGLFASPFFWLTMALLSIAAFIIWDSYDSTSECGKAGTPLITKTVTNGKADDKGDIVLNPGETEIEYDIQVVYQIKCGANYDVEIRDAVPENTTYIEGSAKKPDLLTYAGQGGGSVPLSYEAIHEGNTLVWKIKGLPNRVPIDLTFRVKPKQDNVWVVNEAAAKFTIYNSNGLLSQPLNLTGPSRGLICVGGLDERLLRIFEEAGVAANVSPSIVYGIAYAEKHGTVAPISLDGKPPVISPCGAHGIMQIGHINDGKGEDYSSRCVKEAHGSPNPPETWDPLAAKYNELSGGNMVDPDSDKDSIFGGAFYIKDHGWPAGKNYTDQLTEAEAREIARQYLGDGLGSYGSQAFDAYSDAFKKQGTCGGGVGTGVTLQPVGGAANVQ